MWRDILRNLFLMGAAATFLAGRAGPAGAAEIKDDAGFFGSKALSAANTQLAELKKATGKDVRIETFKSVPSRKVDEVEKMNRSERARFFDAWAAERAKAEHVKGIYVLITRHPGHVQVEVDRPTREHGFGTAERNELRDKLLEGFREKDYDHALLNGVDYVGRMLKSRLKVHAEAEGVPVKGEHHGAPGGHRGVEAPQPSHGMGWLGWVIVAVVVLLGIRLIGALFSGGMGGGYGGGYGYGPGGGGLLGGLMTGLLGAVAGNWLYHSFFDSTAHAGESGWSGSGSDSIDRSDDGAGQDFEGSGGDFDSQDGGGGDFGDSGGGDFGGGDFGGGDFGGGDF